MEKDEVQLSIKDYLWFYKINIIAFCIGFIFGFVFVESEFMVRLFSGIIVGVMFSLGSTTIQK